MARSEPSFSESIRVFARIGMLSFGGPAAQIAVMHKELVEKRRWIGESRFLHALNYCMLLPGPEATQLITYIGWLMHRTPGGIVAGLLFVLPGFLSILALSLLYVTFADTHAVTALFFGLKCAVLALVLEAVQRIGKRALKTRAHVALAALAFVAIFFLAIPFPLIVAGAAIIGLAASASFSSGTPAATAHDERDTLIEQMKSAGLLEHTRPTLRHTATVLVVCSVLWGAPVAALWFTLGDQHVLTQEAVLFSKAAVVTFGGAYSVLAYIAQQAVETFAWMTPAEMLDGLGLAETTPGPLIMVVQFVGFLASFRHAAPFSPYAAGVLGALVTVWVTFVPCFFWIFLGAPYVETLRGQKKVGAALSAITSAVVGVVLNLSVWLALHTIFGVVDEKKLGPITLWIPNLLTTNVWALLLATGCSVAVLKFHIGAGKTLAAGALIGGIVHTLA